MNQPVPYLSLSLSALRHFYCSRCFSAFVTSLNGSSENSPLRGRPRPPQPALQASLLGISLSLSVALLLVSRFSRVYAPLLPRSIAVQVNKSAGPFDALLCVGQFFPDAPELLEEFVDYVEGRSPVPLPTYFIGDYGIGAPKVLSAASRSHANLGFKMDGLKICENLYWLKGSGKFTLHGNVYSFYDQCLTSFYGC